MEPKKRFAAEEAKKIGKALGIDWKNFDVEQFRMGLDVELEHGLRDPKTNVTNDDPIMIGKIALAHLNEFSDYYTRLKKLEEEAEEYWEKKSWKIPFTVECYKNSPLFSRSKNRGNRGPIRGLIRWKLRGINFRDTGPL